MKTFSFLGALLARRNSAFFKLCCGPVVLAVGMGSAAAQSSAGSLQAVTVQAQRPSAAQIEGDGPLWVDVVDEIDLHETHSSDLQEAVAHLPNVSLRDVPTRLAVSASSAAFARDGNSGLQIRGLGGNRVLLQVDGVRMPRSYVSRSAAFDREYLDLGLLKQLQVQRGAGSALFSGEGMAGVVQAHSYMPHDLLPAQAEDGTLAGRWRLAWNEQDHSRSATALLAGQARSDAQWLLAASAKRGHESEAMGRDASPNSLRTQADPLDYDSHTLQGKWLWRPVAGQRHVLSVEHVQKKEDVNLLSSRAARPTDNPQVVDEYAQAKAERQTLRWDGSWALQTAWADELQTQLAWQRAQSRRVGHSFLLNGTHRIRDNRYKERSTQLNLRWQKRLPGPAWSHRMNYGLEWSQADLSNLYDGQAPLPPEAFPLKRFPDSRERQTALYWQGESAYGAWRVQPGLRFEQHDLKVKSQALYFPPAPQAGRSNSGHVWLPKLGVLYEPHAQWTWFAHYATGYRAPEAGQVNDRFQAQAPLPGVGLVDNIILANPDLRPERSRGLELGLRHQGPKLKAQAALFDNRYRQLIEDARLVEKTPLRQVFQTVNIPKARIWGYELQADYDWGVWAQGRLSSSLAYGRSKGRDVSRGAPLNVISPALLHMGLRYEREAWLWRADVRHMAHKAERDIDLQAIGNGKAGTTQFATPRATVLDLGLQWRPRPGWTLQANVHNVTNRKYWLWSDVYGLPSQAPALDAYSQPGRVFKLAITKDF